MMDDDEINEATFKRWLEKRGLSEAMKKKMLEAFNDPKRRDWAIRQLSGIGGGQSIPGQKPGIIRDTK